MASLFPSYVIDVCLGDIKIVIYNVLLVANLQPKKRERENVSRFNA